MRLEKVQNMLRQKGVSYQYWEENDCGSISFIRSGLSYHIWEFPEPERGADTNVRTAGRSEEFNENYEEEIVKILAGW